jgi:phospholipase/carboxylesterase
MTASVSLSFIHRFEPGTEDGCRPLLLLHGTGGDETDLLALGRALSPGSAFLSPRGQVLENGMPRFFRRLAEGVFDEADVVRRAGELAGFVAEAREAYGLAAPIALGFSNGANIAAATLLLHPDTLAGAVLLRAMTPLASPPPVDLAGTPILMVSGLSDPIVPAADATRLADRFTRSGATVEHRTMPVGHALTQADITLASAWLATHARRGNDQPEEAAA